MNRPGKGIYRIDTGLTQRIRNIQNRGGLPASPGIPSLRGRPAVSAALKCLPADRRKLADMETEAFFRLRRQRLLISISFLLPRRDVFTGWCCPRGLNIPRS
jgi:hypothetical protein